MKNLDTASHQNNKFTLEEIGSWGTSEIMEINPYVKSYILELESQLATLLHGGTLNQSQIDKILLIESLKKINR